MFYMYPDSAALHVWHIYLTSAPSAPVSATWSWGDGTYSTGLSPSHTYSTAGQYNICVMATFACGDSSYYCQSDSVYRSSSSVISVYVINATTGIKNNTVENNSVKVYPNPFSDNLTINYNSNAGSAITYTIYDVFGNQVMHEKVQIQQGENNISINTAGIGERGFRATRSTACISSIGRRSLRSPARAGRAERRP